MGIDPPHLGPPIQVLGRGRQKIKNNNNNITKGSNCQILSDAGELSLTLVAEILNLPF